MPRLQKVPGSLRSEGRTTLAIDIPTSSMLKQLAGDIPVSQYIKELALREFEDKQPSLPGSEREVSRNTIAGINTQLNSLEKHIVALDTKFSEYTVKHGATIPISELDTIERIVNYIGVKFGFKVDYPKIRDIYEVVIKGKPIIDEGKLKKVTNG